MKFRCERDLLVDALSIASKAVTNRGTLPVLHGLRLDLSGNDLVITGSDLDLTITVSLEVGGEKNGITVVPAKLLADVIRAVEPGAVDITAEETNLHVVAGRSEFSLRTIPKDEYPNFEEPTTSPVTVDGESLVRALEQVTPAASSDDSRPILKHWSKLRPTRQCCHALDWAADLSQQYPLGQAAMHSTMPLTSHSSAPIRT